jgi:phosphohistidine phosphatase
MQVYLLRHGIAEEPAPGESDADRELTPEGRTKLRENLRIAAEAGAEPTLILSSPLVRALQSAEIASQVLRYKQEILQTDVLLPSSQPERVWDELRVHRDEREVLLVGHDPLFSQLAAYLLGTPALQVDFKKGAILRVDCESFGAKPHGILRWFLTSKLATKASKTASQAHK